MLELGPHATRDGRRSMVCTVDHRASGTADALLRQGGTAVDAAIGASAVLAVTSPHLCGMGGDLLALVHDGPGPPVALDATGRAGSGADAARLRAEGHRAVPFRGHPAAVTIPGCVDGWLALHHRFGSLPLPTVLADAIALAEDGFGASPLLVAACGLLADVEASAARDLVAQAVAAGALVRRPGTAEVLRRVAQDGRTGFYAGQAGAGLVAVSGGQILAEDLTAEQARWVEPATRTLWGEQVWTMPPPSQGYLTLAAGWVLERLDLPADPEDGTWAHLVAEACAAVGADRRDVLSEAAAADELLDPARLERALAGIDRLRAGQRQADDGQGDTMYLCVVDDAGRGVSLIQSNAADFGSHLFEPRSGTNLHNRGIGFRLDPEHPACLAPGRRPPTTLSPALVTSTDGSLRAVLGTMGGDVQPQVVVQLLTRLLHHRQRPGTCVAAPRLFLTNGGRSFTLWDDPARLAVAIEGHAPATWQEALTRAGHQVVQRGPWDLAAGHAHLIEVTPLGGLGGAADPRAGIGTALGR